MIDMQKVDGLAEELVKACVEFGCFRVVNHGVPMELMAEMKVVVAELFNLPDEIKRQTATNSPEHGKGYIGCNPITPFLEGFSIDEIWSPNEFCDCLGASPHQRYNFLFFGNALVAFVFMFTTFVHIHKRWFCMHCSFVTKSSTFDECFF